MTRDFAFSGLRVDAAFFEKMSNQWREEKNRCQHEIDRHQNADKSYMEEGVQLVELARNAQRLFERREPRQNAACSTSYYRTAYGRLAPCSRPSANRLI